MKVITITRATRPQTLALVSEAPKLHSVSVSSVTMTAPYILETKDMFLTFSEQELRDMLAYIEDQTKQADSFMDTLKSASKPDDSGSLV